MRDPDVVNSEMNPPNLSDAEIDAILSGGSAAGAPDQLTEFVALLQGEVHATPGVTPGLALADFMSATPVAKAASGTSTVTSIFKKSTAAAGAVSFKILLGAAAAAAGIGGAQAAGVIDLPRIGSEATEIDLPTDPDASPQGSPSATSRGGSPSVTVPSGRTSEVVSVPPLVELVDPGESLEEEHCGPNPQGPTNASSTSNPSEANRQQNGACGAAGNGPESGDDDRGTDQGAGDEAPSDNDQAETDQAENDSSDDDQAESDQAQRSGSDSADADNDPEPGKPVKGEQSDSTPASGPKEKK